MNTSTLWLLVSFTEMKSGGKHRRISKFIVDKSSILVLIRKSSLGSIEIKKLATVWNKQIKQEQFKWLNLVELCFFELNPSYHFWWLLQQLQSLRDLVELSFNDLLLTLLNYAANWITKTHQGQSCRFTSICFFEPFGQYFCYISILCVINIHCEVFIKLYCDIQYYSHP